MDADIREKLLRVSRKSFASGLPNFSIMDSATASCGFFERGACGDVRGDVTKDIRSVVQVSRRDASRVVVKNTGRMRIALRLLFARDATTRRLASTSAGGARVVRLRSTRSLPDDTMAYL